MGIFAKQWCFCSLAMAFFSPSQDLQLQEAKQNLSPVKIPPTK